jgi:Helix-turn-helix domain
MSNQALRWALELPIMGAKKSVLIALAGHADDAGTCFPSLPRIALFAGTTDRGARKALRELEEAALVRTVHAAGSRSQL